MHRVDVPLIWSADQGPGGGGQCLLQYSAYLQHTELSGANSVRLTAATVMEGLA